MRVYRHRDVGNHLVVDKFIFFGQHHVAVQGEKAAKFRGVKDVDALELASAAVQLAVDPDRKLDVGGLLFRKPKFHLCLKLLSVR